MPVISRLKEQLAGLPFDRQEVAQSAKAYGVAIASITLPSLADVAQVAQSLAIIFGCCIAFIQLCHNIRQFWRGRKKG